MNALVDQFALPLTVAAVVVLTTAVVAVRRRRVDGDAAAWRTTAFGAAAVVLAGTGLPHGWPPSFVSGGDLVLRPGRGGLGDLHVLWQDPTSLAAVLLVLNVVLYVPLGVALRLGWSATASGRLLAWVAALAVGVEVLQWLGLDRVASIDDVLLNLMGSTGGIALARTATHRHRDSRDHRLPFPGPHDRQ